MVHELFIHYVLTKADKDKVKGGTAVSTFPHFRAHDHTTLQRLLAIVGNFFLPQLLRQGQ